MTRHWSMRRWLGWRAQAILAAPLLALAALIWSPAALAFPVQARIGATSFYAEAPITPALRADLARADALVAASPLFTGPVRRRIVLTNGGWRWKILSIGSSGAIALRRPFSDALVFNRNDPAADRVTNGAPVGGVRTLSGTIAHETTHLLVARHLGELRAAALPTWKSEGYADYVAGETSIGGAADEARIRAADSHARVLAYYDGRRRVAAALRPNGGSVERLLRGD